MKLIYGALCLILVIFASAIFYVSIDEPNYAGVGLALVLFSLVPLLIFFAIRKGSEDARMIRIDYLSDRSAKAVLYACGAGLYTLAAVEMLVTTPSAPSGRWAFLEGIIYEWFGREGMTAFLIILGTFVILVAARREKSK